MEEGKEAKQRNFENLKHFFIADSRMKQRLIELYPNDQEMYGQAAREKYIDRLYKELKDFKAEIMRMAEDFAPYTIPALQVHFEQAIKATEIADPEPAVIRRVFQTKFWNIQTKLRDEINESCIGYSPFGPNLPRLIGKSTSINELLHLFHSYILNNETILQSMPVVAKRSVSESDFYVLYGDENDLSRELFEGFPVDENIGKTDIVSMKNRIIMMVRGKGHALTIDMDTGEDEDIIVHYFLPKICNRAMVKKLPGSKTIQEDCAKGTFDTTRDRAVQDIFDLVEKVPSDKDMRKKEEKIEEAPLFPVEDLKQMATMPASQNGRRMGRMEALQNALKGAKAKLQNMLGGEKDEPTDRDL